MIVSDGAIEAMENGEPVWEFRIAVKMEEIQGVKMFFIGFDDMDAWASVIATANPQMRQNMLTAVQQFNEMTREQ